MLKFYRNAGYTQLGVGVCFTVGLLTSAYGANLLAFLFLGGTFLTVVYLTMKESGALAAKRPDIGFQPLLIRISLFFGVIYCFVVFCYICGLLLGL